MTPVAEHGTSARMASKGNDIIAGGKSLASALTIFMGRPSRALFSATRVNRVSLISQATSSPMFG